MSSSFKAKMWSIGLKMSLNPEALMVAAFRASFFLSLVDLYVIVPPAPSTVMPDSGDPAEEVAALLSSAEQSTNKNLKSSWTCFKATW